MAQHPPPAMGDNPFKSKGERGGVDTQGLKVAFANLNRQPTARFNLVNVIRTVGLTCKYRKDFGDAFIPCGGINMVLQTTQFLSSPALH